MNPSKMEGPAQPVSFLGITWTKLNGHNLQIVRSTLFSVPDPANKQEAQVLLRF